jgi:hypothetical protein
MRAAEGAFKAGQQKDGAPYYLHRLDGTAPLDTATRPPGPKTPRADLDLLNRAYSALLARLPLSQTHADALRGRGLSDAEIEQRGYRTLTIRGRARLAGELREQLGDALLSVPGFHVKPGEGGRPYVTVAGAAGLLVPVRDVAGRAVALLVRRDDTKDGGGKYSYLSSAKRGGLGPGAPPHVPLGITAPAETVRLTEGALKADIAFALSGLPTVGAAGLAWRPALDALQALGGKTVRLAFDADCLDNSHVARALADCCQAAAGLGLTVELERWDKADGKGIDDLLAAGKQPEVLTGEAALAAVREALAASTAADPPPEPDGLERLPEVLAAGGAPALFGDKPLLAALARLEATDPAAFAARRATLKGQGVSLTDLGRALAPLRQEHRRQQPAPDAAGCYRIASGRIVRDVLTKDGPVEVPLTNWSGRIVEQTVHDDGAERRLSFAVEGNLADGTTLPRAEVAADQFAWMRWPVEVWGTRAVVLAGASTADHVRVALQLLSGEVPRRTIYGHTGWREIDGSWLYLHGGGAVGTVGTVAGIDVSLPDALANFVLPEPPEGAALAAAVRASLSLLDLAPDRVTVPLLGAAYRAALGPCDCALHLSGPTGAGKTELAALAQQHYGAGLDARHLPGSWASTGNALEGLAFTAAHALLTVDDFAPGGTAADVARMHREADRLLRAQGNRAGRQRMRADGGLRPAKPPRGLILSTGEDVPRGQSLRARLLTLELAPGELVWSRLCACQREATAGRYAEALAGFVRWLAPRYAAVRDGLRAEAAALRGRACAEGLHARTPGIVADLAVGWRHWLDYALAVGAIGAAEREALDRRVWAALQEAGANQSEHLAAAEPCGLFLRLLAGALASGRAHCAGPDGDAPAASAAWGWRATGDSWAPLGRCVGWVDGADLYLEPEAAFAEAQELARHQGDSLPVSPRTLWRRLRERGLLASWDDARQRHTVRRRLGGHERREVLHLRADALSTSARPSPPSPPPPDSGFPEGNGDGAGDGRGDGCAGDSAGRPHDRPQETPGNAGLNGVGDGGDGRMRVERPYGRESAPSHGTRRRGIL